MVWGALLWPWHELKEPVQTKQQHQLDGVYTNQEKVVENGEQCQKEGSFNEI